MPAFNSEETIQRAIDSIFRQEYPETEIIVVDDGSTDNTRRILRKHGSRLKVVEQENQGPAAARNQGLRRAGGRFVAFLDSDDYWLPGMLRHCVQALENEASAFAVSVMTRAIHWSGREVTIPSIPPRTGQKGEVVSFFEYWAENDHIRTGSVLFDRQKVAEMPYFREDLRVSEDIEYWGIMATLGRWLFIPEVYFVTDGSHRSRKMPWRQKNQRRRESCPTVEVWQTRLLSYLNDTESDAFRSVRGRVARGFAHIQVLNGNDHIAKDIIRNYGGEFPRSRLNKLLLDSARAEDIRWSMLTRLLRFREIVKEGFISARYG
jgi:glycosyltransferase involved in cell wall biosynthesis